MRQISFLPLACVFLFSAGFIAGAPPHDKPGPAADTVYFRAFDVDRAARDLESGNMDLYMFSLKTAAADRLKEDDRFTLYEAPASTVSLLLNPAPATGDELNPFSITEVRQGVQYLIDREFIARDIYRGMAVPMITHVSPQDHDYLTIFDIERGAGITYDPEYGRQVIAEAMKGAGASLQGGIWNYGGQPVRLRLIGRVEDERRNIADMMRTELERAGFVVSVSYRPFAAAILSVYSSDPQSFEWHMYTEGWGRSAPQKFDFATINSMNAPWLGNMPGWQEIGFWQYKNDELNSIGKQLFRGEFKSLNERNDIYRRMTQLGLDESVRIWLATAVNSFPTRREVEGVTPDLVAGIRSPWTLREAYIPGKNELTVGHLWVWTERTTWNPIGGIGDVYSADIWRYLHDPAIWNHPHTGIPQPMRVDYEVETVGPDRTFDIPASAVEWNAGAKRWQSVGASKTATSKVIFDYRKYFQTKWHHGQPIEMADVIYSIAQTFDLAYDSDKTRIEVAISVTARPFLETFKAFRILDENRLEVFVDYWHFEEDLIAAYASPAGLSMPWELLAAMDDLVFNQRRAAYSATAASRFNVPWLSLVMERDARLVERTLRRLTTQKSVPESFLTVDGKPLFSTDSALARYRAAVQWFRDTGHLVISNGPFYLSRYDPPAQFAELKAFRDPGYPFKPGDWSFGAPPVLRFKPVASQRISAGKNSEISVEVDGPGQLSIQFLLVDPVEREVIFKGEAEGRGSTFTIKIPGSETRSLFPGLYELTLLASSDAIAQVTSRILDLDIE